MLKSPVCVQKKVLIAHNFFVIKATDLITIIFKKPLKKDVETFVTL